MSDQAAAIRGSAPAGASAAPSPAYLEWQRKVRRDKARIR